jgi:hypothetical protein
MNEDFSSVESKHFLRGIDSSISKRMFVDDKQVNIYHITYYIIIAYGLNGSCIYTR